MFFHISTASFQNQAVNDALRSAVLVGTAFHHIVHVYSFSGSMGFTNHLVSHQLTISFAFCILCSGAKTGKSCFNLVLSVFS